MAFIRSVPLALLLILALPWMSGAIPLVYEVDESGSTLTTDLATQVTITISTGLGDSGQATLSDAEYLDVSLSGMTVVDTGLPDDFEGGANGITISSLTMGAQGAEGETLVTLEDFKTIFNPLIGGNSIASIRAEVHSISIILNEPFSTPLRPGQGSDDYAWGPVDVSATIAMDVTLTTSIVPTLPSFPLFDGLIVDDDFVFQVGGTFSGDPSGTIVEILANVGDFQFETLFAPGGYYSWDASLSADDIIVSVVATNPTMIPEPSRAMLGIVALVSLFGIRSIRGTRCCDRSHSTEFG